VNADATPMTAVLDQLAAHAEKLTQLDARQAAILAELTTRLDALARHAAGAGHGPEPAAQPPAPARRWWKLTGEERDHAIASLRAWVDEVYRPGYGQLAALLGPCWDQHPLCLYGIDILAELWSVLYLTTRTPAILSAQAEYQARILPALADQMAAETRRCTHARDRFTARDPR
jgi:hypothetical protein